jgi:DNA-binding response OmpR family regulator
MMHEKAKSASVGTPRTICVVEDDPAIATLVGRIAEKTGLHVSVSTSAAAALALMDVDRVDLVIADINMPEVSGLELIGGLRKKGVRCPVPFISGDSSFGTVDSSLRIAGASFLPKPFTPTELSAAIWSALIQR